MSDDVRADARRLLQGITPGKWRHCTGPAEGESKAEYLTRCITNADESLHVVIAQSPEPKYAYVIPALTGDGPTSDANAEFIAAAPTLVDRLLAELDNARRFRSLPDGYVWQDYYSPDEVIRIRTEIEAERDAALATLQQVREWAEQRRHDGPPTDDLATVLLDGAAHQLLHILDGGAR